MAATERSASASVVDQLHTEIRIAPFPCHVVPLSQQVPSCWTRSTTARVNASASPPWGGPNRISTWFSTIREARIHFTAVIEECRIAGLDTSAIAMMLGKMNEELVDSIRPEIWQHLEQLIAQRARGRAG